LKISYEPLVVDKHFDEVVKLCGNWWYESDFHKNTGIDYDVDYDQFKLLEEHQILLGIVGRNETGEAVSCFVGCVGPFIYNKNISNCTEMVWHIDPTARSFENLGQLLTEIEKLMDSKGIQMWNLALPQDHLKTGKALEHFGYFKQDTHYMRRKV